VIDAHLPPEGGRSIAFGMPGRETLFRPAEIQEREAGAPAGGSGRYLV
jgi:hypothetical protein